MTNQPLNQCYCFGLLSTQLCYKLNILPVSQKTLSETDLKSLKDALKRCPEGTFDAAVEFRTSGDMDQVPKIVMGIVERYVEPEQQDLLKNKDRFALDLVRNAWDFSSITQLFQLFCTAIGAVRS